MKTKYFGHSINRWAKAIALRISDEWDGNTEGNKNDVITLRKVLEKSLIQNPNSCKKLIGTTIIEEDYFDNNL
ncbi:MAG: hypothetical protein M5U17_06050 [Ignavibacterium sp.]|nr:hypothetical protein [Ignavibacterium sp.]